MGNCKSVDRGRKVDLVIHISQFEHNLQELKAARDELWKCMDQLMRKIDEEEGPSMKPREQVLKWLRSAETKLQEADVLIGYGEKEIDEKKKPGGFLQKNQNCSYKLDKSMADVKGEVDGVKQSGQFEVLVERVFVEADHVRLLKQDIDALRSGRNELMSLKNGLMRRVKADMEGGTQMKPVETIQVWFAKLDILIIEVDQLLRDAPKEIEKWSVRDFSNPMFGETVEARLKAVSALSNQGGSDFAVVVVEDSEKPEDVESAESEYVNQIEDYLEALRRETRELRGLKDKVMEDNARKRLKNVEKWRESVEATLIEVDRLLLQEAPGEIEKLHQGDFSSDLGKRVEDMLKHVVDKIRQGYFSQKPADMERAGSEYVSRIEADLESLQRERMKLWGLRDEVKARINSEEGNSRKRLNHVDEWCTSVEATLIEVDRLLLQEVPREIEKLCLEGDSSFSNVGERVAEMLKDVIDKIRLGNFSEVTTTVRPEQAIEMDVSGETVGLQSKLDEVWRVLMKPEVGVLGIYGIGGVGKTTLLVHLNNRFLHTPSDFDYVIWITVSKDFSLLALQDEIGDRIGISIDNWKIKDITEKSKEIRNILRRKKFVLLLDDLWEKVHLEKAGVPIPKRQNGSKIVLTTRSELVCSLMDAKKRIKVEQLLPDQAWKLFEETVGRETIYADPEILPLAQLIVKECAGLPLVINVAARAMACSRTAQEWRYALAGLQQSASDLQGIEDEVYSRLKLSYDRLPNDTYKSCFLYCALLPEDFKIYKDDLVDYWISEKFGWDDDGYPVTRAKAHHMLRDLINACLLEEEGKYVKLHDVIRDMALWISCHLERKTHNFLVEAGKKLNKAPDVAKWVGVKRASLVENSIRNLPEVSVCPDLRTLLLCRNPRLHEINGSIFKFSRAITVLDLSNTRLHVLPLEVTELFSLQYLNLSRTWIQQLPLELKRLKKLIYLNLEHNDLLGMIPKGVISCFLQLQVLKMFRSGFFHGGEDDNILVESKVLIEEMQYLKHLNVVSITIRSSEALGLYFNTENVQSCTQSLSLECIDVPKSKSIEFTPTEDMDQLETLQVSASEHLEQINFSPRFWFLSLREVVVEYCPRLLNLNWLHRSPNLAVLRVAVCEKIVEISDTAMPFAKLEVLELEGLPQLESICYKASSLPAIKRIRVLDCPLLKEVPLNPEILKLRKIVIEAEDQWWKELELTDQSNKDAFQSCFRNYPPRTRICRAPHHYFDLWSSMYT